MKTLLVLACILALVVPFLASSSGSHSKERRYFGRYPRPPSRPWPMYSYYPNAYYPPAPGGPFGYPRQPGSPYIYVYVLPAPATAPANTPAPAKTTRATTPKTTTTTPKTTATTPGQTTPP